MTVSTCIKCAGHSFELALFTPIGTSKKLSLVQCAQCGTPVGVLDPATGVSARRCNDMSLRSMKSSTGLQLRCRNDTRLFKQIFASAGKTAVERSF